MASNTLLSTLNLTFFNLKQLCIMNIKEKVKTIINSQVMNAFPSNLLDECAEYVMRDTFAHNTTHLGKHMKELLEI